MTPFNFVFPSAPLLGNGKRDSARKTLPRTYMAITKVAVRVHGHGPGLAGKSEACGSKVRKSHHTSPLRRPLGRRGSRLRLVIHGPFNTLLCCGVQWREAARISSFSLTPSQTPATQTHPTHVQQGLRSASITNMLCFLLSSITSSRERSLVATIKKRWTRSPAMILSPKSRYFRLAYRQSRERERERPWSS